MRKVVLRFGLISGGIMSGIMVLSMVFFHDQIGFSDMGLIVGYASMVLAFLMVFFGVRTYRDNVAGGTVKFGRAFRVGFLIMLLSIACYVVTWQVVYYRFMPDFTDKYAVYALDKAKKSGATEAELAVKSQEMAQFKEWYKNPLVNIAFTIIEPLPVGLIITLVTAGVLSRKRRDEGMATA